MDFASQLLANSDVSFPDLGPEYNASWKLIESLISARQDKHADSLAYAEQGLASFRAYQSRFNSMSESQSPAMSIDEKIILGLILGYNTRFIKTRVQFDLIFQLGQYLNRDKAKLGLAARAIRENFEFDLEREEARTRDRVQDLRDKLMDQAVDSLLGRILPLRSYTPSEKNDQPFIMRLEYLEDKIDRVDDQIRRISPEFLKRRLDTTIDIDAAQGLFTQMRLSFHTISFHMGLLRSVLPLRGSLFIHERSTRPPRNS